MANALLDAPLVQTLGWTLLHFIWQGALIGGATAVALRVMRHASPASRYLVACAGLLLMAAAPVVSFVGGAHVDIAAGAEAGRQAIPALAAASPVAIDPAGAVPEAVRIGRVLWAAVLVWIAGVMLLSGRLLAGCVGVVRLKRATRQVDDAVAGRVEELAARLGITRAVRVLESTAASVPTAIGWLQPVILLPASALTGLPVAHLDAVIAHELAHVRRHDYLVNALQAIVETLLFYHPIVWWCSRRIRIERELCCDDLAVDLCGDRVTYARALARLEELRAPTAVFSLSAAGGSLVDRIRRVLSGPRADHGRAAWSTVAILMIATTSVVVLAGAGVAGEMVFAQGTRNEVPLPPAPPDVQLPVLEPPPAPAPPPAPSIDDMDWSDARREIEAALDTLWTEVERALQDLPPPSIDAIDVSSLQRQIEASLTELARETGGILDDLPPPPAPPAPAAAPAPANPGPPRVPAQPVPAAPPSLPAPPVAVPPGVPSAPASPRPPDRPDLTELIADAISAVQAQAPSTGDALPTDAQVDAVRERADDLAQIARTLQRQALELRRAEQQLQVRRMELLAAESELVKVRDQTLAQRAAMDAIRKAVQDAYARSEAFRAIEPEAAKLREQVEALRKQIEAIRAR